MDAIKAIESSLIEYQKMAKTAKIVIHYHYLERMRYVVLTTGV